MERRRLLQLAGAFLAAGSAPGALFAQTTQMTMVVPFPPGGGGDILARTVSLPFSEALREKVVLFNRPGAGGGVGMGYVKRRPGDGRTLVVGDGTTIGYVTNGIMCVNPYLYDRQSFDPLKDLTPVAGLTSIGLVLAVSPKALPDVHTAADLVKHAQARPGETAFASAGPGTTSHLAGILLESEAKLDLNHIPHAGGAGAVKEVLAGRVPFLIDVMPNLLPHLKAGTLRALAVTTPSRSALLPEVPTMVEAGLPGVTLYAWDGIAAPKGLSDADADRFAKAARAALNDKAVRDRLLRMGAPVPRSRRLQAIHRGRGRQVAPACPHGPRTALKVEPIQTV